MTAKQKPKALDRRPRKTISLNLDEELTERLFSKFPVSNRSKVIDYVIQEFLALEEERKRQGVKAEGGTR